MKQLLLLISFSLISTFSFGKGFSIKYFDSPDSIAYINEELQTGIFCYTEGANDLKVGFTQSPDWLECCGSGVVPDPNGDFLAIAINGTPKQYGDFNYTIFITNFSDTVFYKGRVSVIDKPIPDNLPPVITTPENLTFKVGEPFYYEIYFEDPEGDEVIIDGDNKPDWIERKRVGNKLEYRGTPQEVGVLDLLLVMTDYKDCSSKWYKLNIVENVEELTFTNECKISNIEIFPNPATSYIKLNLEEKADITIYDLTGKVVYSEKQISPNSKLDISELKSGLFIISARVSLNTYKAKFFKK